MTYRGSALHCNRFLIIIFILAGLLVAFGSIVSSEGISEQEEAVLPTGMFTGEIIFPIYVSDVQVSAEFYRNVLGFEFLGYYDYNTNSYVQSWQDTLSPKYAGFVAGDQKFGLHKPSNEIQEACVGCGRYYFRVQDLDAEYSRISAHGVRMSQIHSSALLRRFYAPDPDGLKIFFAETADGAPLDPW
jgi:predicted enzyme related to lactoylglutathione lyase